MKVYIPLIIGLLSLSGATQAADYEYDVEGHGDSGYVYGEIEADRDSKDVEGYIYDENGDEKYFEGEWTGKGEIEGYDEDGNYYELEVE